MARQIEDSFWKKDKSGREVIQAWVSSHFQTFKVGDEVECGGRVMLVAAIGQEFKVEKNKFVYLYGEQPVSNRHAPAARETGDGSLDQFESEAVRELGKTGELPGA